MLAKIEKIEMNQLGNINEDAWNKVWNSGEEKNSYSHHQWRDERADDKVGYFLQNGIQFKKGESVLDAGCGDGSILFGIKKHFNINAIGADFSQCALDSVRENEILNQLSVETHKADTRDLPFRKDSLDKILSLGVIEHMTDSQNAVNELARCLKPNGVLILMTPNKKSFGRFDRIIKTLLGQWKFGYQTEFTTIELEQMTKLAGLVTLHKDTLTRSRFKNDSFAFKVIYSVDSIMKIFSKNWGFYSYVFATKKGRF
jgi:ubiquinone/menaquinone biosynthesis C-methylase UbiE